MQSMYHTRTIITHSLFETALDYKLQILGSKIEEFPCLVHKTQGVYFIIVLWADYLGVSSSK